MMILQPPMLRKSKFTIFIYFIKLFLYKKKVQAGRWSFCGLKIALQVISAFQ